VGEIGFEYGILEGKIWEGGHSLYLAIDEKIILK
jgi:hypothetical protein